MEAAKNPNRCIVEDGDTWAAVIGLMRHHMPSWPSEGAERAPVYVQVDNQITKQLKLPVLKAEFQASNRKALGIVVDAETNISSVWQRLLPFLKQTFANFTGYLPTEGLVLEDNDGRRFGIWVMPDNHSAGMLEDFLADLVIREANQVWDFARECVDAAKERGAAYREVHRPKANLHTYLAWQDPPGERFNAAISRRILDPNSGLAPTFVGWFKRLYQL